jgi:hypothetical protein
MRPGDLVIKQDKTRRVIVLWRDPDMSTGTRSDYRAYDDGVTLLVLAVIHRPAPRKVTGYKKLLDDEYTHKVLCLSYDGWIGWTWQDCLTAVSP